MLGLPAALLAGAAAASTTAAMAPPTQETTANPNDVVAPISGTVIAWKVAAAAEVKEGDLIAVMEAMKMETQVLAHRAGRMHPQIEAGVFLVAGQAIARID